MTLAFFEDRPQPVHLISALFKQATICGLYENHPEHLDLGAMKKADNGTVTCPQCIAEIKNAAAARYKDE